MKKRVLVIGSSGMLGVDLCHELRGGYRVYGADRVVRRPSFVFRFFDLDITKRRAVETVVRKAKPDAVVLTAAWTDVDGCERDPRRAYAVNAAGPENVARACKSAGIPLIYISTDFIFNGKKRSPYREDDTPAPLSVYGDSKFRGELAITKILKDHVIVRTSWLYGRHGKNFVDTIIAKGRTGPLLRVVDDQVGSPTYTKDLARAVCVLLKKMATDDGRVRNEVKPPRRGRTMEYGIYHVSNAGKVSWYDYAKTIVRLAGLKTKVAPISSKELDRPAKRPSMSALDTAKFRAATGHVMRAWKDALKEYIKFSLRGGIAAGLSSDGEGRRPTLALRSTASISR